MPILPGGAGTGRALASAAGLLAVLLAPAGEAQTCGPCPGAPLPVFVCAIPETIETGTGCLGRNNCQTPALAREAIEVIPTGGGSFEARLPVDVKVPYNSHPATLPNAKLDLFWSNTGTPADPTANLCEHNTTDRAQSYVRFTNLTCAGAPYELGTYAVRAIVCNGGSCRRAADLGGLTFRVTKQHLGCPDPPVWGCNGDAGCTDCIGLGGGGGGGGGTGGGGGGAGPPGSGPGARLRYRAGGAGGPNLPGTVAWNALLGRFWAHDYAERIVPDPGVAHVWLLTRFATFREFTDQNADGAYEKVAPSDEERRLFRTAAGWELRDLDGTVHSFDGSGLWTATRDKNGNAKTAVYSGALLTRVTFPDGRREDFGYAAGRLATITAVGVGGETRTWSYTWSGLDLARIERPDGTAWEFFYSEAPGFGGYLTRMDLVGTDHLTRRVEAAWDYDDRGNVLHLWRGDPSFTGPNAVDRWSFAYDDPALPTRTEVTDALGKVTVYEIGRDTVSNKPKVTRLSGDCPSCGTGPNAVYEYNDPANPLRPTAIVDGRGLHTEFIYDGNGRPTQKLEAAGTPLQRDTLWTYDSAFPAFPRSIDVPSTSGGAARRVTRMSYDAATGDLEVRTLDGAEAGGAFSYATATTYNAAGRPLAIDPPGYGTDDVTTFSYDVPGRNGLLPDSRTDPLAGTTRFGYDGFNRRTSVIDPNGVETATEYDPLDRVTKVTQEGDPTAMPPVPDLVTRYDYDTLGDLFRITLPLGNVFEYGHDFAGRLTSIERKPDAVTHGERTFYTLDAVSHRTKEELQRWNGIAWVTGSSTGFVYSTRCHLDKAVQADGSATEYAYDCDGNLEKVWDANHPRLANPTPTQAYAYDALNRLTTLTQPWAGAGGGTAATSYAYDVQDHLQKVTDANGNATTYTTSDRDLMTEETSIVTGTTTYRYNEHGELTRETDARPVTVDRTIDAADRLTLLDYPDDTLDTAYTYDDPAAPFSKGRLTSISRPGSVVDFAYDRFGRTIRDGALSYAYDANGNRVETTYPGGVRTTASYDFADRQATLSLQDGLAAPQPLVTASTYQPFGPLASLAFGNGLMETRGFDARYIPTTIAVPSRLSWTYTTDHLGNPTAIADHLDPSGSRAFSYQDVHYFLTRGDGPWGTRAWTYDRIGNRLAETRDGATETYTYLPNLAGGNTPKLLNRGVVDYHYDPIGDTTAIRSLALTYDDARDLHRLGDRTLLYDGRGFLREASAVPPGGSVPDLVRPTYGSEGVLQHRLDERGGGTFRSDAYFFTFAGRPIATYEKVLDHGSPSTALRYLTTDPLGTPILATTETGATTFNGGFEPFGADFAAAQKLRIYQRFPGQWQANLWYGFSKFAELHYNVHRWYEAGTGRYTQPDPLGKTARRFKDGLLLARQEPLYAYGRLNPLAFTDPLGLSPVDRSLCITKWITVGAGIGAGIGGTLGAAGGGTACTFIAPGAGTLGCGAGGGSLGAAGGGALGGSLGGFFGSLVCPDDCNIDRERRRRTHEHCVRLYEICVSSPGRHRFTEGARCGSCLLFCEANGYWPFDRCQLNYYPNGL